MVVKRIQYLIGIAVIGMASGCSDNANDAKKIKAETTTKKELEVQAQSTAKSIPSTTESATSSKTATSTMRDKTIKFEPPRIVEYDDEYPPTVKEITDTDWSTKTQSGTDDYYGDVEPAPMPEIRVESDILEIVDEPAEYPGGMSAMREYLKNNMMYPMSAKEAGIQGKCYLRFIVNTDGSISDVRVLRGVADCPECDKEATRVVKNMPNWKPGRMNGKDVKMYFTLPISFKLT